MQQSLPLFENQTVSQRRLPTNSTTRMHPVHRWFNFIAGFSPEYVEGVCAKERVGTGDLLLDPFAGCGTAPLVAVHNGLSAVAYEPHPIFFRICQAKLALPVSPEHIAHIGDVLKSGLARPCSIESLAPAQSAFLTQLFSRAALEALLGAREAFRAHDLVDDHLAFLVLSKVVEKSTHSQTDGIYKAPTSHKTAIAPGSACDLIIRDIQRDLACAPKRAPTARASIIHSSSESMSKVETASVSLIVTSPPYLNNFDYAEMTRMLLYFWGFADSWSSITDRVRARLVVNTTTALKGHKGPKQQEDYRARLPQMVITQLEPIIEGLRHERAGRAGKKEYDFLVYPYFAQMFSILEECSRTLRPAAPLCMMVADAALYGIHIPTPQILCEMLTLLGLEQARCSLVRSRGHRWTLDKRQGSRTGLGEYEVTARRASAA